jgi:hypothetical protein
MVDSKVPLSKINTFQEALRFIGSRELLLVAIVLFIFALDEYKNKRKDK